MRADAELGTADRTPAPVGADATSQFDLAPSAPSRARRWVAEVLSSWGHGDILDEATVVVSELATNAVVHARTPFSVSLTSLDGCIHLVVGDGAVDRARAGEHHADGSGGRGLDLVTALALRWGQIVLADGKLVWADLPCTKARARPFR